VVAGKEVGATAMRSGWRPQIGPGGDRRAVQVATAERSGWRPQRGRADRSTAGGRRRQPLDLGQRGRAATAYKRPQALILLTSSSRSHEERMLGILGRKASHFPLVGLSSREEVSH
jgi:hypothetical protein